MTDTPVYLVCGFLYAGKTSFINETLADPNKSEAARDLVISFEEGETEIECDAVEYIENADELSPEGFIKLQKKHNADRIIVEYNGMWQLGALFDAAPKHWVIGQIIVFFDATCFASYNKNMRSLVVDKIQNADMIIFNRMNDTADFMELHRVVRGLNRDAVIIYEDKEGKVQRDEIEDPLPFDKNADVIAIEDKDYALFYRDLCESMADYDGKTVRFTALVAKDKSVGTGAMFVGRHVMTCCAEDIQYTALICKWGRSDDWNSYDWVTVEAEIKIAHHKAYEAEGPVLIAKKVEAAQQPEPPVATFY